MLYTTVIMQCLTNLSVVCYWLDWCVPGGSIVLLKSWYSWLVCTSILAAVLAHVAT